MTNPRLEWKAPDGGDQIFLIRSPEIVIGRKGDADLVISSQLVSRHHAKVIAADDGHQLVDLGSTFGTFVNNERVESRLLRHGDEILFGKHEIEFRYFTKDSERPLKDTTRIVQRSFEDLSRVLPSATSDLEKMLCVLEINYLIKGGCLASIQKDKMLLIFLCSLKEKKIVMD